MRRFAITPGDERCTPDALRALRGRVDAVILREPGVSASTLERLVDAAIETDLEVWVHARCAGGLELAARRDLGVHLPSDHPPVTSRHGRSCHDAAELDRAFFEGCTYALLSPVFPPSSKPEDRRSPLGIEEFLRWSAGRPVVALGGVDAGRAEALDRAGAWGIAAISAYFPCGQKANRSSS